MLLLVIILFVLEFLFTNQKSLQVIYLFLETTLVAVFGNQNEICLFVGTGQLFFYGFIYSFHLPHFMLKFLKTLSILTSKLYIQSR